MAFGDKIQGLLGNPAFNFGVGLLSQAGPSTFPIGFGQALASGVQFASQAERAKLQNDFIRDQLLSSKRKEKAIARVPGILSSGVLSPQGRQEQLTASLFDIDPEAAVRSLLSTDTERAAPSIIRIAEAVGFKQGTPEFNEFVISNTQKGGGLENQKVQIEITRLMQQVQAGLDDKTIKKQERRIARATAGSSVRRQLATLDRLDEIQNELEATFASTGIAAEGIKTGTSIVSAITNAFGVNSPEATTVANLLNEFEVRSNGLAIDQTLQATSQKGGLQGSVAVLRAFQESKLNINNQATANRALSKKIRKILIDFERDNELNLDLPQGSGLLNEQPAAQPAQQFSVESIPGFSDMTPTEQAELRALIGL